MPDEMIIKTAEGNLVDEVYSSPVDEWQHRARGLVLLIAVIVIALIVIYFVWYFGRDRTALLLRYPGAFQVWIHWKRAGRNDFRYRGRRASALPGVQNAAAGLPGQTARRLRVVRAGVRAESRYAGRRFAALAFGNGAGGSQLLGVPYGNRTGKAG